MIRSRPDGRQDQVAAAESPSNHLWQRVAVVAAIIIAVTGLVAIFFPTQFRHQLEISIVRQPTPYTQLFFSDPAALPEKLEIDRVNSFSFTVINDQGTAENYHYTVTLTRGTSEQVVTEGSLPVADKQSVTHTVEIKPTSHKSRYLIKVALSGTVDYIEFYGTTS